MRQSPKSGGGQRSCCDALLSSDDCSLIDFADVAVDVRWAGLGWTGRTTLVEMGNFWNFWNFGILFSNQNMQYHICNMQYAT